MGIDDDVDISVIAELSLQSGQTFGDYRIIRALGQGGMGEVYEGIQQGTERHVALKVMSHRLGSDVDRKRFLREGRLAASVSHPNTVYIFGSEEIEERPVIVMELVRQGTLKDRVEASGPLPVTVAVDAILQVIDGLEAAHANGILHRDIKPANCFVDSSGSIKIGDFGLSISTHARPESTLTAAGALLGTPTFASPEQLRSDPLDVRADIYSAGATLYYLLTGHPPHQGQTLVQLLTQVLNDTPKPPHQVRREVPSGLSRVVLRCLSKSVSSRYADYRALRAALVPFSSQATPPATLARRVSAGLIDLVLVVVIISPFKVGGMQEPGAWVMSVAFHMALVACFGVMEGVWGTSPGKAVLGLRAVALQGGNPGIIRATARAALYWTLLNVPELVPLPSAAAVATNQITFEGLVSVSWILVLAGSFFTMRRDNGYATFYDLLTGTRVARRVVREKRRPMDVGHGSPQSQATSSSALREQGKPERFGPYVATESLAVRADHELFLGYDEVLKRRVWIVRYLANPAPLPEAHRDVARTSRLRWLHGQRTDALSYDIFERPEGMPLLSQVDTQPEWFRVRVWLQDLAEEFAEQDRNPDSAVAAALERIWITRSGRAILLDFPAQGLPPSRVIEPARILGNVTEVSGFLGQVATLALGGTAHSSATTHASRAAPPPLHAHEILNSMRQPVARDSAEIVTQLRAAAVRLSTISPARRLASMTIGPALLSLFGLAMTLLQTMFFDRKWDEQYPHVSSLRQVVALRELDEYVQPAYMQAYRIASAKHRVTLVAESSASALARFDSLVLINLRVRRDSILSRSVDTYIATRYRGIVGQSAFWTQHKELESYRAVIERAFALYRSPSAADSLDAVRRVQPLLATTQFGVGTTIVIVLVSACLVLGAVSLVAQVVAGSALGLRIFGLTIVNNKGRPASRLRLLLRWLLAWIPLLLALGIAVGWLVSRSRDHLLFESVMTAINDGGVVIPSVVIPSGIPAILVITALISGIGIIWALLRPQRGLHDRLSGTWLVPR